MKDGEKWNKHTKKLPQLDIGDHMSIQNGQGNSPLKWEKRGVIVSFEGHDKYIIWIDGSHWLTFRNCKHLKKFIPLFRELDISYKLNDYDYGKSDLEDPVTNQNW